MDDNNSYSSYSGPSPTHTAVYEGDPNALTFRFKELGDAYVQSRSDRIRAAMFPEMYTEEEQNGESFESRSCIVERLAEPSQLLKTAVIELLSVQDESEIATKAIPELVKLLSDKDETVVQKAAHMVHLLSKEDKSRSAIATNAALVAALCSITRFENETIRRDALAALSHISEHAEGRMHLFRSGGIPELVRMLGVGVDGVRHYAITTLHNLLLYMESAKQETRACGGLEAMTPLLRTNNPRFLALLVDSLYLLVLDHPQSKLSFLSLSGPALLISLLETHYEYPKLLYTVVRCIRAISVCPQNKAALVSLGALQMLSGFIEGVDDRTQFAVLCAVRNLSDAATNEDTLASLILRLIGVISCGEEASTACAAGVLSNLTCNNVRNKHTFCANRGMETLCFALRNHSEVEEVTEPALCALRHCTARHSLAAQAQSDVKLAHTVPVILELLCTMRAPVVKAALGLVRNLALLPANLQTLAYETNSKGASVVSLAMDVLARAGAQLRQDPEAVADGVAMRELVEGAVSALHQLANEPQVAITMLRDHPFIDIIIKLLSWEEVYANEDELLQRELLGLLYQLSKTPEGARQLDMYGPTPVVADALHSKHKAISTYASGVLKNLQFDKPIMYQEELETEIESAISGVADDADDWMNDGLEPELFAEMYQSPGVDRLDQHAPWQPPPYHANNQNPSWFDTDL